MFPQFVLYAITNIRPNDFSKCIEKNSGAPNESVPQRNLAGWQNSRCSDELAGKFVTAEGFVLVLMMFPSISSIAW